MPSSNKRNPLSETEKEIFSVDLFQSLKDLTIVASLPRFKKKDTKLTVVIIDKTLTFNYMLENHTIQRFSRVLMLPDYVNIHNISSKFQDGILQINMPRMKEPQQISGEPVTILTYPEEKTEQEKFVRVSGIRTEKPVEYIQNKFADTDQFGSFVDEFFSRETLENVRNFHKQIPGYRISPLKNLSNLATKLGLGGIWVKDESDRMRLNSFKVLGGSYAIGKVIQSRLGISDQPLSFAELTAEKTENKLGKIIFSAATDGNHGRGVAWAASQLGYESIIYVHKLTSRARIEAIEQNGAKVVIIDGTYDDAVRQINTDSEKNGWQVISDTSWEGYEQIPQWVMQGYSTMIGETQEQLAGQGLIKPTHIFAQAGVGALAGSVIGYYAKLFGENRPKTIVVEPNLAPCLYQSIKIGDGEPHSYEGELNTIMAGLACGDPNPLAWNILRECTDYFIKCPDYVAAKGMRVYGMPLPNDPFIISGESGAVTLGCLMFIMLWPGAAELRDRLHLGPNSQILLINSEGDTDPNHFRHVVWEGGIPVPHEYRYFWP